MVGSKERPVSQGPDAHGISGANPSSVEREPLLNVSVSHLRLRNGPGAVFQGGHSWRAVLPGVEDSNFHVVVAASIWVHSVSVFYFASLLVS